MTHHKHAPSDHMNEDHTRGDHKAAESGRANEATAGVGLIDVRKNSRSFQNYVSGAAAVAAGNTPSLFSSL